MPDDRFEPAVDLPSIPGLVFRHLRVPDDYTPMNEIANASRLERGFISVTSVEDMANFYGNLSHTDPARDVIVAQVNDTVVAYARTEWNDLRHGGRTYELVCFVASAWTRKGIGRALQRSLEARTREVAATLPPVEPSFFQVECPDQAFGERAMLEQEGYEPVRWEYQMERPNLDDQLDAPMPEGLEIREVRTEHMRAIWEADQEAFADHWGAIHLTEQHYQQFLTDRIQGDTSLWRVAWDGDQVAGQVRSYINEDENRMTGRQRGWVENISVRRPWRHRGLARALMAASFPLLRARGATEGALGVDTENPTGALRVYESVGFHTVGGGATFHKPLEEATPPD